MEFPETISLLALLRAVTHRLAMEWPCGGDKGEW